MAGGRVVRARDREQGEGPVVVQLAHPSIELGRGEDGEQGAGGHVDDGQVVRSVVELGHDGRPARGAGHVGRVAVVLGPGR